MDQRDTVIASARLDRVIEALYARYRRHWVIAVAVVTAVLVQLVAPILGTTLGLMLTQDPEELITVIVVIEVAALLGTPALAWVIRRHHWAAIQHCRGMPVDPVDVWVTSVVELPRGVTTGLARSAVRCSSNRERAWARRCRGGSRSTDSTRLGRRQTGYAKTRTLAFHFVPS